VPRPIPHCPADVLADRPLQHKRLYRGFSNCTTAPRHDLVPGYHPPDGHYKMSAQLVKIAAIKKAAKRS